MASIPFIKCGGLIVRREDLQGKETAMDVVRYGGNVYDACEEAEGEETVE